MTKEERKAFLNLFKYIYKDDQVAIDLSFDLLYIVHVWDDLIDKDKPISDNEISDAFLASTVSLTLNPLWGHDLAQNFLNIYLRWETANHIESREEKSDNELAKAWMLRAGIYDIFTLIAVKLYGIEWGRQVGPSVVAFYGETLEDFLKEVKNA